MWQFIPVFLHYCNTWSSQPSFFCHLKTRQGTRSSRSQSKERMSETTTRPSTSGNPPGTRHPLFTLLVRRRRAENFPWPFSRSSEMLSFIGASEIPANLRSWQDGSSLLRDPPLCPLPVLQLSDPPLESRRIHNINKSRRTLRSWYAIFYLLRI